MIWVKINFAIYIETNEEKFKKQGNFFLESTVNRQDHVMIFCYIFRCP